MRTGLFLSMVVVAGCGVSHRVPVGGDDGGGGGRDGGAAPDGGGDVDAGGGLPCGAEVCGAGQMCCLGCSPGELFCVDGRECPLFDCPPPGCTTNADCGRGAFCQLGVTGIACSSPGFCEALPSGCDDDCPGVCGCDGLDYCNPCYAASEGVTTAHDGACATPPPPMRTCGGFGGVTCARAEYCDYPDGAMCGAADVPGVCRPRPGACPDIYDPVCGCDGRDYGNGCEAAGNGTDVAFRGTCAGGADCRTTGCPRGRTCEPCGLGMFACLAPGEVCATMADPPPP